jgi:hypothetical protein
VDECHEQETQEETAKIDEKGGSDRRCCCHGCSGFFDISIGTQISTAAKCHLLTLVVSYSVQDSL